MNTGRKSRSGLCTEQSTESSAGGKYGSHTTGTGTRAATYRCTCSTSIDHPPHSPRDIMSSPPSQSTSRSNFDSIFNSALQAYKKKTGKDIASHPLATELQSCDSPNAMLAILRRRVPSLDQPASSDEGIEKCLVPIVNVLYAFSATIGEGVGLVIITILSLWRFFAQQRSLRCSHQQLSFFLASAFYFWSGIFYITLCPTLTCTIFRRRKKSTQAKTHSLICSVGSSTSSVVSRFTPAYHLRLL